jgi:IS5 family transposase
MMAGRYAHAKQFKRHHRQLRIGKGKASAAYEFGVKASIVTTNGRAPGDQFVLHAKALPGNPYDGHTLRAAIEDTERLTGHTIERAYVRQIPWGGG